MPQPNIKTYIILSGILVVIFIALIVIPVGKKNLQENSNQAFPTPTTVDLPPSSNNPPSIQEEVETVDFTGVSEEELPPEVSEPALQKQELRSKVPLDTGLFGLDFDYAEDKFVVTLYEPKSDNLKQFEEWKKNEYPSVPIDQFIFE